MEVSKVGTMTDQQLFTLIVTTRLYVVEYGRVCWETLVNFSLLRFSLTTRHEGVNIYVDTFVVY
jgi:hypothetical protein